MELKCIKCGNDMIHTNGCECAFGGTWHHFECSGKSCDSIFDVDCDCGRATYRWSEYKEMRRIS